MRFLKNVLLFAFFTNIKPFFIPAEALRKFNGEASLGWRVLLPPIKKKKSTAKAEEDAEEMSNVTFGSLFEAENDLPPGEYGAESEKGAYPVPVLWGFWSCVFYFAAVESTY